ncbi:MAG: hypothetical protein ACOCT0_02170 [Halobacteriota archaeon]
MALALRGNVDSRITVNYRVDVDELESVLPDALVAREVDDGVGVGGVCLGVVRGARPGGVPRLLGVNAESALHRVAVEWDGGKGCYVVRRDVDSTLGAIAGRALLPGALGRARTTVDVDGERFYARVDCDTEFVRLDAREADGLPGDSVFGSPGDVLEYYGETEVAYAGRPRTFERSICSIEGGEVAALDPDLARSSFFEGLGGEFDSAVVTRDARQEIRRGLGVVGGRR